MTNYKTNPVPIQEVQYLQEEKIPTVEEIKNGAKLPKTYVQSLLNPQARFDGDLVVFPVSTEIWRKVQMPCPGKDCTNTSMNYWVHAYCYKDIEWSTHARVKCVYHNNPSHVKNWRFKCHGHSDFQEVNETTFTLAVHYALKTRPVNADFSNKLLDYLSENRWPD